MANSDVAIGLRPVQHLNGAPYNGQVERFSVPATDGTAIYLGDLVKLAGSADADGVPTATLASSTDEVLGVVVAVEAETNESLIYRAASTLRNILVVTDPSVLFEIQEDSEGGALAATSVGLNANFSNSGGTAATGKSTMELDSSSANTTATLDFQIVRLAQRADNEIGTNAKWLVRLNNHQYVDGTTGI